MHSHVLALLTPDETPSEELIAAKMAPHEEEYNEATEELTGHWDWYVIGGRWDGALYPENEQPHECSIECHYSEFHRQFGKNVRPVAELPEGIEGSIAAILTPDGQWLEPVPTYNHPEFPGWGENSRDAYRALSDRLNADWRCQVRRTLVEHNTSTAVSVDIHA